MDTRSKTKELSINAGTIVKARIPRDVKERAVSALERIGCDTLNLMRVADEGRLPFDLSVANRTTLKAVKELGEGTE